MKKQLVLAVALSMLLATSGFAAIIISRDDPVFGPGSITRDTVTGLEWLDLTLTRSHSVDVVASQLGPGGEFEGFRYATSAEVRQLFTNAGIPRIVTAQATTYAYIENIPSVPLLMSKWGITGTFFEGATEVSQAVLADGPDGTAYWNAVLHHNLAYGPESAGASVFASTCGAAETIAWIGHALVRQTPPDPVFEYNYTGNKFNLFSCAGTTLCPTPSPDYTSYTTDDFVTVVLRFSNPLPANLNLQDVRQYAGFSLTAKDGRQELTTPVEVLISTDAGGMVVEPWSVICSGSNPPNNGVSTVNWVDNRGVFDTGFLSAPTGTHPENPYNMSWIINAPGSWTTVKPVERAVESLTQETEALVETGTLTPAQADGLLDKLDEIMTSLDMDATRDACNQLRAFINQVKGLVRAGKLTPGEGQALIDAAEDIRTQVGC